MRNSEGNPEREQRSRIEPHDEFLELCALSTSGDLTEEEHAKLQAHVAVCAQCREALKEFEAVVDSAVPLVAPDLSELDFDTGPSPSAGVAEAAFFERLSREETPRQQQLVKSEAGHTPRILAGRLGQIQSRLNWNHVWLTLAATILLTVALGLSLHTVGIQRGEEVSRTTVLSAAPQRGAVEKAPKDGTTTTEIEDRDKTIAKLKQQIKKQSVEMSSLKTIQADTKFAERSSEEAKQQITYERNALADKVQAAQTSLEKIQADLDSLQHQRSQDIVQANNLQGRVDEFSRLLRDRDETIQQQQELLAHDRDIRELMGARDLYIAEVYDVARNGQTQKPYGRVFYTKGKSLIFYAYDLNQATGVKNASTFQAWGQRGPDMSTALNMGVFYEDSVSKKRWVLKFDDPKMLEQIDAVFVTVEPDGGSNRPSGKRLLYAYLRTKANHP